MFEFSNLDPGLNRLLLSGNVEVRNNEAVFISAGKLLEDLIMKQSKSVPH